MVISSGVKGNSTPAAMFFYSMFFSDGNANCANRMQMQTECSDLVKK